MNKKNAYLTEEDSTDQEFSDFVLEKQELKFRGQKFQTDDKMAPINTQLRNAPVEVQSNNFVQRTIWTFVLISLFLCIMMAGHFYIVMLVFFVTMGIFNEILSLKINREKDMKIPNFQKINWYFFTVGIFLFYGQLFTDKINYSRESENFITIILKYHNLIAFILWTIGFLMFVISLNKGTYKYQFSQFAWTHLIILLIVAQTSAVILNTYEGLIWMVFPSMLVVTNDIFAYIFGKLFGKHQLIALSPKKTWEGFLGGCFSTIIIGIFLASLLQTSDHFICRQNELILTPFVNITCKPSLIYEQKQYDFFNFTFNLSMFQIHSIILSLFASFIAPFGGFFASGFKRALKIKDFAEIIPGHGGITDRMDCQILMGVFTYLYLHQIIQGTLNYTSILQHLTNLPDQDQLIIFQKLHKVLTEKNLLNQTQI